MHQCNSIRNVTIQNKMEAKRHLYNGSESNVVVSLGNTLRKGDVTNEVMFMVVCDIIQSILVVITLSLSLRTREADCNFKF